MIETTPLLTVAIPTWNRSPFLEATLEQIHREMAGIIQSSVEVLVSDNCSSDRTLEVVKRAQELGLNLKYFRNAENIGSDANIAQCFNLARGKYVLVLGDDDLFVDCALKLLLERLAPGEYGVVCMKPYGFDTDFRLEYPGSGGHEKIFYDAGEFLAAIGQLLTLISSCAINKNLLPEVDARQFCGDNLVQVHLVLRAALAANKNIFIDHYLIGCKRNNSGGYDFSEVFVTYLGTVLDSYMSLGLTENAIQAIERRLMLSYYPFNLLRQRLNRSGDIKSTLARFEGRFRGRFMFRIFLAPVLYLPRPLAIIWGGAATLIGRTLNGEFRRGIVFIWHRIRMALFH